MNREEELTHLLSHYETVEKQIEEEIKAFNKPEDHDEYKLLTIVYKLLDLEPSQEEIKSFNDRIQKYIEEINE